MPPVLRCTTGASGRGVPKFTVLLNMYTASVKDRLGCVVGKLASYLKLSAPLHFALLFLNSCTPHRTCSSSTSQRHRGITNSRMTEAESGGARLNAGD